MYINLYRIQSLFSGYKSRIIEKNGTEGDIYDVPCLTGFQILEKASLPLIPHYLYISRTFSTELLHYASVNDDICFLITVSDLPDRGSDRTGRQLLRSEDLGLQIQRRFLQIRTEIRDPCSDHCSCEPDPAGPCDHPFLQKAVTSMRWSNMLR